jgi:transcription initiation factor TFIID subunit 13
MSAKRTDRSKKRVSFEASPPRASTPESRSTTNRRSPTSNSSSPQPNNPHPLSTPPWPFNDQDTKLIQARYKPQWNPESEAKSEPSPDFKGKGKNTSAMAEPRARMARHKGQMNFQNERTLSALHKTHQQSSQLTYTSSSSPPRLWRSKPSPILPQRTTP